MNSTDAPPGYCELIIWHSLWNGELVHSRWNPWGDCTRHGHSLQRVSKLLPTANLTNLPRSAKIGDWIATYLKQTEIAIQSGWEQYIGNASADVLTGSTLAPAGQQQGILGAGNWVDSTYADNVETTLQNNLIKIVTYQSINFAWLQSNVFIIWMPYDEQIRYVDSCMHFFSTFEPSPCYISHSIPIKAKFLNLGTKTATLL